MSGIVIAVMVVVLFHFRSRVISFFGLALNGGIQQAFNLIINLGDILKDCYRSCRTDRICGRNRMPSYASTPPPLVTMKNDEYLNSIQNSTTMQPLEPAFINEEDYPQNWMVYDSKRGVIEYSVYRKLCRETSEINNVEPCK